MRKTQPTSSSCSTSTSKEGEKGIGKGCGASIILVTFYFFTKIEKDLQWMWENLFYLDQDKGYMVVGFIILLLSLYVWNIIFGG